MSNDTPNNYIFTDEQIENFAGFYCALKRVHDRLVREGYVFKNGEMQRPTEQSTDLSKS